ncbi:MAG: TetR/AcrR family transcriptional regulator [Desulfobacterales bacterium]|jgi:AcrR family transcriptional regulator
MQVLDEQKRAKILAAAAKLFAAQPFHKVLLSDVAVAAAVGKGTVYTYFKSKEDLYFSVLYSGFSDLLIRLQAIIGGPDRDPAENLGAVVEEMVDFAYQNPHHFELMRTVSERHTVGRDHWDEKRRELRRLIESVIRDGIDRGVFEDPHPEMTARFIPGCVRSMMFDGIESTDASTLTGHILGFVLAFLQSQKERA